MYLFLSDGNCVADTSHDHIVVSCQPIVILLSQTPPPMKQALRFLLPERLSVAASIGGHSTAIEASGSSGTRLCFSAKKGI